MVHLDRAAGRWVQRRFAAYLAEIEGHSDNFDFAAYGLVRQPGDDV